MFSPFQGISALIQIQTINVTSTRYTSWLSCTLNTLRNIRDYSGQLKGLMGNFNGLANDDVDSFTTKTIKSSALLNKSPTDATAGELI